MSAEDVRMTQAVAEIRTDLDAIQRKVTGPYPGRNDAFQRIFLALATLTEHLGRVEFDMEAYRQLKVSYRDTTEHLERLERALELSNKRGDAAADRITELERDLRLAWEVRDAYQFEKEQAEKERDEALEDLVAERDAKEAGRHLREAAEACAQELEEYRDEYQRLWHRDAARAKAAEEALREVLADDGNCTEDEPQDPSCPRCRARKLLSG